MFFIVFFHVFNTKCFLSPYRYHTLPVSTSEVTENTIFFKGLKSRTEMFCYNVYKH